MFEDWRDWRLWAVIGFCMLFLVGGWVAIILYGGPECFNDYDYWDGWEGGCWGGQIRYNGYAVIVLFSSTFMGIVGLPHLLFDVFRIPKVREVIARSGWRRRQLFRWLGSFADKPVPGAYPRIASPPSSAEGAEPAELYSWAGSEE